MNAEELKEYWAGFPEAPLSDTFKYIDVEGFEHMITVRGWEGAAFFGTIGIVKANILGQGGIAPATRNLTPAPAPQPDPAAKIALEAGNKAMAQELQASYEAVPPAANGQPWQTVDVNEVRIEPKADGLVSVEFWNPGRQYAEEYVKWKPENVKGLLKHIMTVPTNDDGTLKPGKHSVNCRVYYSLGKEKTGPNAKPGSRWHDVAHVRLV